MRFVEMLVSSAWYLIGVCCFFLAFRAPKQEVTWFQYMVCGLLLVLCGELRRKIND